MRPWIGFGASDVEESAGKIPTKAFSSDTEALRSTDRVLISKTTEFPKKNQKNGRMSAGYSILTRHYGRLLRQWRMPER
jgi:hypothetical protein